MPLTPQEEKELARLQERKNTQTRINASTQEKIDILLVSPGLIKDNEKLTICMGGVRSQAAAELITKKNNKCSNISDGFLGNNENAGWKKNNLPCK